MLPLSWTPVSTPLQSALQDETFTSWPPSVAAKLRQAAAVIAAVGREISRDVGAPGVSSASSHRSQYSVKISSSEYSNSGERISSSVSAYIFGLYLERPPSFNAPLNLRSKLFRTLGCIQSNCAPFLHSIVTSLYVISDREVVALALSKEPMRRTSPNTSLSTLRWQGKMDKTRSDVKAEIKGNCVKFTGFLFYDSIHADESQNIRTPGQNVWRKTAWEVHPVTSYEILDDEDSVEFRQLGE